MLDLGLLALACVFAVFGFFSGAARQVAQLAATVVAYLVASPAGKVLAPLVAAQAQLSLALASVLSIGFVFLLVYFVGRFALTVLLRRVLSGGEGGVSLVDRLAGAALGAVKLLALAYLALCAAAFLEASVSVAGRRLQLTPKGSVAMDLARQNNILLWAQFPAARQLQALSKLSTDPQAVQRLQKDPSFQALLSDERVKKVLSSPSLRRALETGDVPALLQSEGLLQLLQDPKVLEQLEMVSRAAP
jgi:membrane protein required for colicin V production